MHSEPLRDAVDAVLRDAGDPTGIQNTRPVGGGCIHHVLRLDTGQQSYLLKWNPSPLPDMFVTEARGLELMHATNTVRVPAVLAASNATADHPAYILLEWLEGSGSPSRPEAQETLGRQLAAMHQAGSAQSYGLDHDNYLGTMPQYNGWDSNWVRFYRERRLRPQMEMAERNGVLPAARRRNVERVLDRLDSWLGGIERRPALLHGDLWGGNVIAGPGGVPAIIDPAAYYGDREAELAYTELFGGFGARFYHAYEEAWPTPPGRAERRDLYNLYHLINHLNHFGESYGAQTDAVLRRYS
jgi:fructosamine-3-kinase